MEKYFLSDPELNDPVPMDFLSHKEKYEETVRKACVVYKKLKEMRKGTGSIDISRENIITSVIHSILKDGDPFSLNNVMMIPVIIGQATPRQQAMWLQRTINYEIIGTYAQTELGHGTFIRGLETTAHYDPTTQEFILNSPTLTSYKWWPGGLGQTTNYAIVVAQLYTQGVYRGIHLFMVQLRNEETHEPLPGIKIGEIGTKLGMNNVNNGFLGFENVHIPREHMLMKYSKVLEDGSYIKSTNEKLAYGGMTFVRVSILKVVSTLLAKACTIAIRYSAVRRQSEMKPGEPEPQILDYRTQQYKLFPYLAASFALKFTGKWLLNICTEVFSELEEGKLERLPELHALSCCLKAVCTTEAAQGAETCRLACGGHGYMMCSNLPSLYGLITAACTYEGENTVLLLQTARYLMKAWQQAVGGMAMTPTVAYLKQAVSGSNGTPCWEGSTACIVSAFQQVAARKVKHSADIMGQRIQEGVSPEDAWNMTSVELVQCAEAHGRAILVERFVAAVAELNVSVALKTVLAQLRDLYTIYTLLRNSGDFLMYTEMTPLDYCNLQNRMETLLSELRPNAVGIVDGFDFHDDIIASTLGSWDGQVYDRLFAAASKSPLNQDTVNESFHKYLKPMLKSGL
ncbi:probable peroxisomal acyl-coenzyme A oxidase 1 isoform X2 [Cryptotermes secundus]|uniref:probable peroxisomal acyl-coenzyme A oxidase 1 isoform X2 n=1 Tax=Cryptotermes secundus TaxID=105785 RepID=UPI000CD7AFD9|nr:probable peroxisomal acyl-coenzyme A oxidase 1 isoform X2 [Cryptotermes secundus]